MSEQSYWRRGVIASWCIHCLLFVAVGWFGGGLFGSAEEPEVIEMELVSSAALPEQAAPVPIAVPQAASSVTKPAVPAMNPRSAPAVKPAASTAADAVVADRYNPAAQMAVATGASGTNSDTPAAASGTSGTDAVAPPATAPSVPKKIAAPRVLSKVEPEYPEDAKQAGVEGSVGVKVEVLENGRPGEVQLARSSGRRSLDEAALQAVRKWRFVPAQETGSGEAVRCYTTFSVVFELS